MWEDLEARVATASDLDGLTDTACAALRERRTWLAGDCAAIAVWVPPDVEPLASKASLLAATFGERAASVERLFAQYEAARPSDRPHHYLTLLATHPDHRGSGLGMRLLRHTLACVDRERMPACLAVNDAEQEARYARVGFATIDSFLAGGEHRVATMWREPCGRPGAAARTVLSP